MPGSAPVFSREIAQCANAPVRIVHEFSREDRAMKSVRKWMRSWGATPAEEAMSVPGGEKFAQAAAWTTRAIDIDAPVKEVWPWLVQIGQDRGGFYSYSWLENLVGCRLRNASSVHPEWQGLRVGDGVRLHPKAPPLTVTALIAGRALALEGWIFLLEPVEPFATRLIARTYASDLPPGPWWSRALYRLLMNELTHFIMERRMLIGIKRRAEAAWRETDQQEHALRRQAAVP